MRWFSSFRLFLLRDAAASLLAGAILFHGALHQRSDLHRAGESAILELQGRGYSVPTTQVPVVVQLLIGSVQKGSDLSLSTAAGWEPGRISLREQPHSEFNEIVYLRHELMHEAVYRSCPLPLPEWVLEGSAMEFSGEVPTASEIHTTPDSLLSLKKAIHIGATLSAVHRRTLAALISHYGWPKRPCEVPENLKKLLSEELTSNLDTSTGLSYVVMNLISGRVFATSGKVATEKVATAKAAPVKIDSRESRIAPIGSLLKIPFAAMLANRDDKKVGRALVRSDTDYFASLRGEVSTLDLCMLLSFPLAAQRQSGAGQMVECRDYPSKVLLGESDLGGQYPFQYSLLDTARLIRLSFLTALPKFPVLPLHSEDARATLFTATSEVHAALGALDAWAKTGTASSKEGNPLWGHLVIAWPRANPTFIGVFRLKGVRGNAVAGHALPVIRTLKSLSERSIDPVTLPLLSALPRAAYKIEAECPSSDGLYSTECIVQIPPSNQYSWTGKWRILTTAKHARPVRYLRGDVTSGGKMIRTDPVSYTGAVTSAEGGGLPKAAREALRAVVFWNATNASSRHTSPEIVPAIPAMPEHRQHEHHLCDTTHCMVFMGEEHPHTKLLPPPNETLLDYLDAFDARRPATEKGWLEFSTGGEVAWSRDISIGTAAAILGIPQFSELRRYRLRNGSVEIHTISGGNDTAISCEQLTLKLDLPSCPLDVKTIASEGLLRFEGLGRGHGRGLSLTAIRESAKAGSAALDLLKLSYP